MPCALAKCSKNIRSYLGQQAGRVVRINLSSGYRCPLLNTAVGSGSTSDHLMANAADWKAPDFGDPFVVATTLKSVMDELGIGQLIYEYGRWVHTSRITPKNPVNRVISIFGRQDIRVGIVRQ